ncbi:Glycosyltransferase [Ignavibacterium album JCM 16511]|uniref:Glycosyltransferase n=1 Tax=Ignavibacterium album (strain DSM 19864 / JCM 16511 / NBRC 101810 / Mat9-16) TaxID=945713 RepID=I0ANA9_IGNAJ|nr:glycosyltransferase [Ignavibacterium album]AFH50466.1 Glycosyltransferase [Ignavibacterium album JCM 16511]
MKKVKHILILTPGFPSDENDSVCIPPLQDFLLHFKEAFPQVQFTIIAFHYPFDKSFYKWHDMFVLSLRGKNLKRDKIFVWDGALTMAKYLYGQNRLDIVHSLWLGECAFIGNRIAAKYKIRHICTLMGQDVSPKNIYLKMLNKRKIEIVALSENQSKAFEKITGRNVDKKIFWGVPAQKYDYSSKREIDLIGVGSLIPLKNFKLMIKTIKILKKDFPEINCKLIGAGNQANELKKLCKENNLEKNIEFLGKQSRDSVFEYMRRSKILFHPSTFEGSGMVFAEALANGMHIVSFNVGYAQKNSNWQIANSDEEMISNVKRLLSSALNHTAQNLFPIEKTINDYAKLYGLIN